MELQFLEYWAQSHSSATAGKLEQPASTTYDFSVARRLIQECSLQKHEQGLLLSFVCQSLWTARQLRQAGYDVDATCMCGAPSDSISHRLHFCPCARGLRGEMLTE
eukprot:5522351-Pyramimonas_sp.AAC.1